MKFFLTVVTVLALITAGGMAFLSQWEIPVPRTTVDHQLPNDQFQK